MTKQEFRQGMHVIIMGGTLDFRFNPYLPATKYVFVGAMLPDGVYLNDGWFNVGFALGKLDTLDDGVYVSMHGWATPPVNVLKQLQEARFDLHDYGLRR